AWNIHTLMDKDNVPRPERRTALIARELACYNIDIAALSETRLAGEGSIEERGGGYTFFWKGKAESEGGIHGVGLTIKTTLLKLLPDLPIGFRLIRAVFNLHIIPPQCKRPKMIRAIFNTAKLKHLDTRDELKQELEENLSVYLWEKRTPSEKWSQFKEIVTETAKTVLGLKKRVHQDWFDENEDVIIKILNEKQNAFVDWQDDPTSTSKKDRFKHLQRKAQFQLQTKNLKKFFDALKTICGPSRSGTTPLLSSDGTTLIKDKAGITQCWAEHFNNLLSRSSSVDPKALDLVPQQPIKEDLDLPPSLGEVKTMNTGKAPGKDGIMAEIYKAAGPKTIEILYNILYSVWEVEEMPKDLKDATIIPLFKNKGSKGCGNYRGISLLSIAGKILARIILNRLILNISENMLPEAQCGFRPGASQLFGLTISLGKTEVLFQSSLTTYNDPPPCIFIQGTKLKNADNLKYLGSNISSDGSLDIEISSRLCK
uniref:Reverse transcriptase domain-containing protein n=1 Tax=Latimeria chalumnae TaxID=7897 RepID=H3ABH8_LATCH